MYAGGEIVLNKKKKKNAGGEIVIWAFLYLSNIVFVNVLLQKSCLGCIIEFDNGKTPFILSASLFSYISFDILFLECVFLFLVVQFVL